MVKACCKTKVLPLDKAVAAAVLATGMFVLGEHGVWERRIEEEGTTITSYMTEDSLIFALTPPVASMEGHEHKRLAASCMYEMACRYAQKVNGRIEQFAINVYPCLTEGTTRVLANYPETRFDYSQLCPGFQTAFSGEAA